jgi:hypothetical protein
MIEFAEAVGNALETAEDAKALREAAFEYSNDLKLAIAALERSIREHWRVVATERFQPLIGLGELMSSMNVPNDLGARLVACGRAGTSSAMAGTASELYAAIKAQSAQYDALQAERAKELGDDEVGDFINALADKRATLAMVTPKVRAWLEAHNALERLGITTR